MIKNFEQLKEMLKAMPVKRRVAVVPAQDEHTLEAISHAYKDGMVEPVLIGDEPKIREILAQIRYRCRQADYYPCRRSYRSHPEGC